MKVFLSHKMTGLTEEEVMKIRNEALEYLQETYGEIELIDNYHHKDVPENAGRLWHLGTSIRMMEEADAIYFCDGWEDAKGCCIEYEICKTYGIKILPRQIRSCLSNITQKKSRFLTVDCYTDILGAEEMERSYNEKSKI